MKKENFECEKVFLDIKAWIDEFFRCDGLNFDFVWYEERLCMPLAEWQNITKDIIKVPNMNMLILSKKYTEGKCYYRLIDKSSVNFLNSIPEEGWDIDFYKEDVINNGNAMILLTYEYFRDYSPKNGRMIQIKRKILETIEKAERDYQLSKKSWREAHDYMEKSTEETKLDVCNGEEPLIVPKKKSYAETEKTDNIEVYVPSYAKYPCFDKDLKRNEDLKELVESLHLFAKGLHDVSSGLLDCISDLKDKINEQK